MNEQALKDAYDLFVQQGYNKSIDDFKQLIASNDNALKDSYNLFTQQGYNQSIDSYKTLLGVSDGLKKKEEPILPMAPQQEEVPSAIPGFNQKNLIRYLHRKILLRSYHLHKLTELQSLQAM